MKTSQKVEFIDKYFGSFLGAVIGDAIGWPQEDRSSKIGNAFKPSTQFQNWKRKCGSQYYSFEEEIDLGSYSDDGQLLFSVARSLNQNNWFSHFVKVELPFWPIYERGGGGATKKAATLWSFGNPPWKLEKQKREDIKRYFNAGGNGVAMRILPHVYNNYNNRKEMTQQVFLNGIATHGHPRALLSAILYAWAIEYLIRKDEPLGYGELVDYLLNEKENWSIFPKINNFEDWIEAANLVTNNRYLKIWEETITELVSGLLIIKDALNLGVLDKTNSTLTKLNCFDKQIRGAGTVACLVSIYISSKYAAEAVSGLLKIAFSQNSDADTNASMVGGLLGAIHGTEWIDPNWYKVQDIEYIKKLVNDIDKDKEDNNPKLWPNSEKAKVLNSLENNDGTCRLGPFKEFKVVEIIKNKPITKNALSTTYKLSTAEGQTLFIKNNKKVDLKNVALKKEKTDINMTNLAFINNLDKIYSIVPPRLTARRVFKVLLDISDGLENWNIKDNNPSEIEAFSSNFIEKGIEKELVISLIHFVLSSNKK